jgi:hypothetical protein
VNLDRTRVCVIGALCQLSACVDAESARQADLLDAQQSAVDATCGGAAAPVTVGTVHTFGVDEASGIVASAVHRGAYYLHDDSGDSARIFAIAEDGSSRGTYQLPDVDALDWEDIARGPCEVDAGEKPAIGANVDVGANSCLYIADVGDNALAREHYTLLRVAEPDALTKGVHTLESRQLRFRYPDGSHNAEAMFVHPRTGELFVVTKVKHGSSGLYRVPHTENNWAKTFQGVVVAAKLGELTPPAGAPEITGADMSPSGEAILLRTYTHVFRYAVDHSGDVADALTGAPCALPVAEEKQGEAIAWWANGRGFVTLSEGFWPKLHSVQFD